jgi:hypothetical protein
MYKKEPSTDCFFHAQLLYPLSVLLITSVKAMQTKTLYANNFAMQVENAL